METNDGYGPIPPGEPTASFAKPGRTIAVTSYDEATKCGDYTQWTAPDDEPFDPACAVTPPRATPPAATSTTHPGARHE